MKRLLFLLLTVFALISHADSQNFPFVITSSGGSPVINWPYATGTVYITTNGVVNLSTTYSLSNADLPQIGQYWYVRFNASKLTVTSPTNVNLFGVYPEKDYPGQPAYVIYYEVMFDSTNSNIYLFHQYISTTPAIQNITYTANFKDTANFTGPLNFNDPSVNAPSLGAAVVSQDGKGRLQYGCVPWCTVGNSGTNSGFNFLGTTDTANLEFRQNNQPAGKIESTNNSSTAFGYQAAGSETAPFTTAMQNCAFGYQALKGVVNNSQFNCAFGYQAMLNQFTGISNTAFGYKSLITSTSGAGNTAIGRGADVIASNTTYGIALGYLATASSSQLAISPNVRSLYFPGMPSCLYCSMEDTSGNGNFQAVPLYSGSTFTPVTGDSVLISNTQNTVNPAGTIANFTIIFPANPQPWKVYNFSFTQTVTSVAYSTRLSGGTVSSKIPTGTSTPAWGAYWNPTLSEWILAHN